MCVETSLETSGKIILIYFLILCLTFTIYIVYLLYTDIDMQSYLPSIFIYIYHVWLIKLYWNRFFRCIKELELAQFRLGQVVVTNMSSNVSDLTHKSLLLSHVKCTPDLVTLQSSSFPKELYTGSQILWSGNDTHYFCSQTFGKNQSLGSAHYMGARKWGENSWKCLCHRGRESEVRSNYQYLHLVFSLTHPF